MDDLISRSWLLSEYDKRHKGPPGGARKLIEEAPSAQSEIIRCKDCKYADYMDDVKAFWCSEGGRGKTVALDDFCSYAERREVTE